MHYRVPFFEALRSQLRAAGFELRLAIGDALMRGRSQRDEGNLEWAFRSPCRYLLGERLCWQSLDRVLDGAQFVVVTQENRLLNNLPLLLAPRRLRVGLWGHGKHMQAGRFGKPAERLKRFLSKRADWWFAYTTVSAELMMRYGPADRIPVVDNAVDT